MISDWHGCRPAVLPRGLWMVSGEKAGRHTPCLPATHQRIHLSCHVMSLSVTAYPFPWGHGVLLLEPIPALSQGTPWTSRQLIAGPSLMSNVGFSILLKDTSTCSSALPWARIWTSDLLITSRPALPAELQPPPENSPVNTKSHHYNLINRETFLIQLWCKKWLLIEFVWLTLW